VIGVSKREVLNIIRCSWVTGNITCYGARDLLFSAVKATFCRLKFTFHHTEWLDRD
jgi:hypothetical protein